MILIIMPREIFFIEFKSRYVFLSDLGLSISATKSEVLLFSKKRIEASPRLTMMGGVCLPDSTEFKYLGPGCSMERTHQMCCEEMQDEKQFY
jgi:hypothetical protein